MQRVIYLNPDAPKCVASSLACSRTASCASHEVLYTKGRPVEDFTQRLAWFAETCPGFIAFSAAIAPEVVRKAHPAIGSSTE